jgi:hypothetical protein
METRIRRAACFPDRWPNGDPPHFADPSSDTSPAKQWILAHRKEPAGRDLFALGYGKRPGEELYDLSSDPDQRMNVAGRAEHERALRRLRQALREFQQRTGDPRAEPGPTEWDDLPAQLGPSFKYPEFMPADNAERLRQLKERFERTGRQE